MRRAILGALLALFVFPATALAADPPAPTTGTPYAGPCQIAESQGWWRTDGITVPSAVGEHIHVQTCIPTTKIDGTITLEVKVTQHNGTGPIKWLRACRESSYCQRWSTNFPACADCSKTYYLPVNFGAWPTGVGELRLTANVTLNGEGKRQFQSTGWPIPVRSTTCSSRCNIFWEARGWYEGHGYQNARLTSGPANIRSGGSISVRLDKGADGLTTKYAGVFIDPDFHHGSAGIVVKTWNAGFTGSVTLPTLSSGPHKLVLVASDGQDAGVLAFPFLVP